MKNIIYLLVMICITYNFNLAQSGEGELPPLEIAVRTDNFNSTDIIRFQMEPIGSNWCSSNYIYYLTNSTVISNETVVGNYDLSGRGFNICSHNQGWEFFWDGFYKMTIYVAEQGGQETEKIFFYLDYRDCNSTCQFDISIKYDNINGLYYAPQLTFNYVHFNEGAILTHWDIDNCSPRCVHDLPDFWQNCLVIIPDENNHPHLVWGPYPFDANFPQADGYKIFRKVDNSDWGPITTTDNDIFEFIDDDFIIASMRTWHYLYYKIAAYYTENNNYHQSGFSNTCYVETPPQGGVGSKRGGYFNSKNSKNFSTTLYQNYPNPFNPTTNIKFQIKEKGYVRLKVFNMLGREVAVLVSEIKEPGKYTLQFNANNLPSGIYIYSLKVNDFIQNHKMILLK